MVMGGFNGRFLNDYFLVKYNLLLTGKTLPYINLKKEYGLTKCMWGTDKFENVQSDDLY